MPATRGLATAACAAMLASVLGGCAAWDEIRSAEPARDRSPTTVTLARDALAAGNLDTADTLLSTALAPMPPDQAGSSQPVIRGNSSTAALLALRAQLRIRQGRYAEAESDALTAMALVPATPSAAEATTEEETRANHDARAESPRRRPPLTQRWIHIRLAQAYEDAGRDRATERHLEAARALCAGDAELVEAGNCNTERKELVRVRMALGEYADAEALVLEEIADVQSRYGAYDLRLSTAMCNVARFYARQGKYVLSGPLFARSFDLWNRVHGEALADHDRAVGASRLSPLGKAFLTPRAGAFPLTAPCGLEDQPLLLYKLGKAGEAANAMRFERELWKNDERAWGVVTAFLDAQTRALAPPLEIASARHAVAFVALRKGDRLRAERELRAACDAYEVSWPTLSLSDRRYYAEDYLRALESLVELLRSSNRFDEAVSVGEQAESIAASAVHEYDSLRLDTIFSLAKTFREMRDGRRAERASARYLEAIVEARGDESADYAWALRTISYAYLLRDQLDASGRMEMQARAIWAKQSIVAPAF